MLEEGSVREDVIEDDASEGGESREGSEKSEGMKRGQQVVRAAQRSTCHCLRKFSSR